MQPPRYGMRSFCILLLVVPRRVETQGTVCGHDTGGFSALTQINLDSLSGCQTIDGQLEVAPLERLPQVSLPIAMTTITGSLEFLGVFSNSTATESINAESMRSIGSHVNYQGVYYGGSFGDYPLPWGPQSTPGLLFYNFASLNSMSFPTLDSIGGDFLFAQNPAMRHISGFPKLVKIGGSINITGNFDSIDFPNLNSLGGTVHIQSTSPSFQCPNNLQSLPGLCGIASPGISSQASLPSGTSALSGLVSTTPTSTAATATSGGGGGLSSRATGGIVGGILSGCILILVAMILFLLRKRRIKALDGQNNMSQATNATMPIDYQRPATSTGKELPSGGLRYPEEPEAGGHLNIPSIDSHIGGRLGLSE